MYLVFARLSLIVHICVHSCLPPCQSSLSLTTDAFIRLGARAQPERLCHVSTLGCNLIVYAVPAPLRCSSSHIIPQSLVISMRWTRIIHPYRCNYSIQVFLIKKSNTQIVAIAIIKRPTFTTRRSAKISRCCALLHTYRTGL